MSDLHSQPETETKARSKEGAWAKTVSHLDASGVKADMNINVSGKQIAGPLRGFGQLWQKTYTISLTGAQVTPQQVVQAWKEKFGSFWPKENKIYTANSGVAVNDVAVLNLAGPMGLQAPGGRGLVATGILVIYEGRIAAEFVGGSVTEEQLGFYMTGGKTKDSNGRNGASEVARDV